MKIAVVHPIPLVPGTIDIAAYVRHFEEMGHESLLVTSKYLRGPTEISIVEQSMEQMADPSTWRQLGIDVAVTFLWFQHPQISEALSAAGAASSPAPIATACKASGPFPAAFSAAWLKRRRQGESLLNLRASFIAI